MFTTTDQSLLARERAPPRAPGSGRCGSTTVGHRPPPWSRQPPPTSGPPASVTSGRSPPGGPVRPSPITPGRPAATPPTSASTARHKAVIVLSDIANDASDLGTQLLAHRNSNPQPRPGTPVMTHNLPGPTRASQCNSPAGPFRGDRRHPQQQGPPAVRVRDEPPTHHPARRA
jgi:hypothetical protein